MQPCGIVVTYMDWSKWKTWWFNIPLFLFQLTFMVVGTAIGKIKWAMPSKNILFLSMVGWLISLSGIVAFGMSEQKLLLVGNTILAICFIASFLGIPWRRVWRAAQASHVRLVLCQRSWFLCFDGDPKTNFEGNFVANFGYPTMEIQPWPEKWNKGQFEYREPMFETTPEFIEAMIQYAHDQVGKGYDDLQLISNGLHLIPWIVYPPCWGNELKIIKAFNRKGGREQCISGVTACLRWGEDERYYKVSGGRIQCRECGWIVSNGCNCIDRADPGRVQKRHTPGTRLAIKSETKFFKGYSTATTSPCLAVISKNWKKVAQ